MSRRAALCPPALSRRSDAVTLTGCACWPPGGQDALRLAEQPRRGRCGPEIDHGRNASSTQARRPARQAARGPAPDPGPRHLRRRPEGRRHAAPRVQAERHRARPDPLDRHQRRRGAGRGGGGLHRPADRRVPRPDAHRHAVPVAGAPRGGGRHGPFRRRSGRGGRGVRPLRGARRGRRHRRRVRDVAGGGRSRAGDGRAVRAAARRLPQQRRPGPAAERHGGRPQGSCRR